KFFDPHDLTPAAFDEAGVDVNGIAQILEKGIPASRRTIEVTFTTRDLPQDYDINLPPGYDVSEGKITLPVTDQMVLGEIPCRPRKATPTPPSTATPEATSTPPVSPKEEANRIIRTAQQRITALKGPEVLQVYSQTAQNELIY